MGKLFFAGDLVTPSNIVAEQTEVSGYDVWGAIDIYRPNRSYRADLTTLDSDLLTVDFGSAATLSGIYLDKVNFTKFNVESSADDITYTARLSAQAVVSDTKVDRWHGYYALTTWNYRYLKLVVSATATACADAYWEVGSIAFPETTLTFSRNFSYDSSRSIYVPSLDNDMLSGGMQRFSTATRKRWQRFYSFGTRSSSDESDFDSLRDFDKNALLVVADDATDLDAAYLCWRLEDISITDNQLNQIEAETLSFREI